MASWRFNASTSHTAKIEKVKGTRPKSDLGRAAKKVGKHAESSLITLREESQKS
jgi:hypothetical protein